MTPATALAKLLTWSESQRHPRGFINRGEDVSAMADDVGYIDRMLRKYAGDSSEPCERAGRVVDPTFRVGVWHSGHYVKEPWGSPERVGDVWAAVVRELRTITEELSCRMQTS